MGARKFAGIIGAAVLLTAGLSEAGSAGHVEPLDGMQGVTRSANEPGMPSDRGPLLHGESSLPGLGVPQVDPSPRTTTPFGGPLPPSQLTPAPMLPFNPNRSLMPSASAPPPYSGSGRLGR
jgi:hypothetical protein